MEPENCLHCIYCGSNQVIKYGRHHGKQRYLCQNEDCRKTFSEDTTVEKFTRTEREALSLLISFLEGDIDDKKTIELLSNAQQTIKASRLNNIKFKETNCKKQNPKVPIKCAYPRILICKAPDNDEIQIIKLPEYLFGENTPSQEITLRIYNSDKNTNI